MKAIVCRRPVRVEHLIAQDIQRPVIGEHDILVRVEASSINPVDFFPLTPVAYAGRWLRARGRPRPEILGSDFAGTVEAVGSSVTRFKPGDAVFGGGKGAFAGYLAIAETAAVVIKPATVSFEAAGAVPVAAITALQAVRDHGRVQPGQKVLVNGASGGVGSFTLQLAKVFGAEVTAVCSPRNLAQARSLGADRVIDYTTEDFTRGTEPYDLLLDVAGSKAWSEMTRVLKPEGRYVLVGASKHTSAGAMRMIGHMLGVRAASLFASQHFAFFIAKLNQPDLAALGELLATGKITAAIDRRYELERVPEAMAYQHEGHAKGKIVVRI